MQMKLSLQVISFSIVILAYCLHEASPTHFCQKELKPNLLQAPFLLPSLAEINLLCKPEQACEKMSSISLKHSRVKHLGSPGQTAKRQLRFSQIARF